MTSRFKPIMLLSLGCLTLLGTGLAYWQHRARFPSTDDAYVKAHVVTITPKVNGTVSALYVQENQFVHQGELMVAIDDTSYRLVVAKAQAELEHVTDQIHAADLNAQTAAARAKEAQAELNQLITENKRMQALAKRGYVARVQAETSAKNVEVAQNHLLAALSQLQRTIHLRGATGENNASFKAAQAALQQAMLNLQDTELHAPCDGYVSHFELRQGDVINAYKPIFSLVERQHSWVEANFKETDLKRIREGQPATLTVDMYPGMHWRGRVGSLSYNSSSSFSLLPPENASANWVKVTQRFPVRIEVEQQDASHPLRLGASATVTVDTR